MGKSLEALRRRERRLLRLRKDKQYARVNNALRKIWESEGGQRPHLILVRRHLVFADAGARQTRPPAPAARLLNPRGIALRFYLLAVFEAQCRLPAESEWTNDRPFDGGGKQVGWSDCIAIDAAYNGRTDTYLPRTKQNRTLATARLQQIKGALRTLTEKDMVDLPYKANERDRDYGNFTLMNDAGRGDLPTAHRYETPTSTDNVIGIPRDFFLHGWIHVLNPSEVATWLTLRFLRGLFPGKHDESGVFLHGQIREEHFHLKRDAYEDSCNILLGLGLIRRAPATAPISELGSAYADATITLGALFVAADEGSSDVYEPHRYQLTDDGLAKDGLEKCLEYLALERRRRGD